MAQTTSFETAMKNTMLNKWRDYEFGFLAEAYDENGTFISSESIAFGSATTGKSSITANVTLNIPSDTTVAKIEITEDGAATQLEFVLAEADHIYFEYGGDLIITQCNVEIGN